MDEKQISENIKRFRRNRRISLDQLARLSGLTKGYLSKIENSKKAPPFSTMIKIAKALNVDVNFFISANADIPEEVRMCLVHPGERKEIITRETLNGYHYEALAYRKLGKNMEPYIVVLPFDEAVFSHDGEEFIYILEGTSEFVYDDKRQIVKKGDSIYIDSALPHGGRSIGKKRAKALIISYSYKRR
jgi:transcriptional regulator with XRE-family HTH domain